MSRILLPRFSRIIFAIVVATAAGVAPVIGQESGNSLPPKTWSCRGNVWVFNGVELGLLDRGKLALVLGDRVLPAGCYWYDDVSGMFGKEGGPPAGDLAPGLELGGPLRADASNGSTDIFLNGREVTPMEVQNLKKFGVSLKTGRYWIDPQGVGGREGKPAEFQLSAAQPQEDAPSRPPQQATGRPSAGSGNDHLYQSGDTHGGIQGNCVFISGPGYSFMGEGC